MPKKSYCGGKTNPPKGRRNASSPSECKGQVRAFGRRMYMEEKEKANHLLLNAKSTSQKGSCGKRSPSTVLENCVRQKRMYGLLPIVESMSDLKRRSFLAKEEDSFSLLPEIHIDHPYTNRVYTGRNLHTRGKTLLLVSVVWGGVENVDEAAMSPTLSGGVGYAFGWFDAVARSSPLLFNIVHVFLNPAYRRGEERNTGIAPLIVEQLVSSVLQRGRDNFPSRFTSVRIQVDPNAPCFQLGNSQYMSERKSMSLERMYTDAGFEVVPLPSEGRGRRMVQRTLPL